MPARWSPPPTTVSNLTGNVIDAWHHTHELDASIGGTAPACGGRGHVIRGEAGPAWASYDASTAGAVLIGDGTDVASDTTPTLVGLLTLTATPALEIDVASGDPVIVLDTQGADKFTLGVDDSDSDKFKINSGGALADPSDFEMDSSGNVEIGGDFNLLTGKGIIHADGVTAGHLLVANGTRYVPAAASENMPVAPSGQGYILRSNATPAWEEHLANTLGAALVGDGTDIVSDTTPIWADDHTWDGGVLAGTDSPKLNLVGGTNDDTASIYLDEDGTAGNSDLVVTLCATDSDSRFIVEDSANADVAYIDADGNAGFLGHVAIGDQASVSAAYALNVAEGFTDVAGTIIGTRTAVNFSPGANFATDVYGNYFSTTLTTAHSRTGNWITGLVGFNNIGAGIDARDLALRGAYFVIDVEDAGSGGGTGATYARTVVLETPRVDTGSVATGIGLLISEGAVGTPASGASFTTLYGLYVSAISAGATSWTSYFAGGNSYHAGDYKIGGTGTTPSAQLHVDQSSASGAQPVLLLDQGDASEEAIKISYDAADVDMRLLVLDVTGAPELTWDESEDDLAWNKNLTLSSGAVEIVTPTTTTTSLTGLDIDLVKSAGATDYNDDLIGQDVFVHVNHTGVDVGNVYGLKTLVQQDDGDVGHASYPKDIYGHYLEMQLIDDRAENDAVNLYSKVYQHADHVLEDNMVGIYSYVDANGVAAAGAIGVSIKMVNLPLHEPAGDPKGWALWTTGANSYHAERLRVGGSTAAPTSQVYIENDDAGNGTPGPITLTLDQQDVDQAYIQFLSATVYTGKTGADEYLKITTPSGTRYLRCYT